MEDFEKKNDALESEQDSAAEAAEAAAEAQEAAAETAENAESEVVDTTPETESQTEETAGVETDAVSDTAEAVEPAEGTEGFTNEAPVPVKKKKIQTPIIIAAIVLVLALIGGAVFFLFFNNSVVGTWVEAESASADEASGGTGKALRYYTFEKDGTAKISLGTMQVVGTWSYANDDSSTTDQPGNTINVAISYFFTGTFKIDVQGNAITGKTLELEGYGSKIKFNSAKQPEANLKVSEKFDPKNEVVGKWKNSEQNVTYTFNEDGTCNLNQMDMLIIDGVYNVNKKTGKVDITYVEEKENTLNIEYKTSADKKTITFSGLEYKKVEK